MSPGKNYTRRNKLKDLTERKVSKDARNLSTLKISKNLKKYI